MTRTKSIWKMTQNRKFQFTIMLVQIKTRWFGVSIYLLGTQIWLLKLNQHIFSCTIFRGLHVDNARSRNINSVHVEHMDIHTTTEQTLHNAFTLRDILPLFASLYSRRNCLLPKKETKVLKKQTYLCIYTHIKYRNQINYRLVKAYQKINKFSNVISYFCTQRWYFKTDNVQKLAVGMTAGDEELFDFDISHLNWFEFLNTYVRGIRVYLIKDPMETVESAKKRYRFLKLGHITICTVVGLSLLRLLMFFVKLTNLFWFKSF